jgi:hypothetical protein
MANDPVRLPGGNHKIDQPLRKRRSCNFPYFDVSIGIDHHEKDVFWEGGVGDCVADTIFFLSSTFGRGK